MLADSRLTELYSIHAKEGLALQLPLRIGLSPSFYEILGA